MTQIQNLEAAAIFIRGHRCDFVRELSNTAFSVLVHAQEAIEAQIKALIS